MYLTTMTCNALIDCARRNAGWTPDYNEPFSLPPKEVIAALPYEVVKSTYSLGKLGLADVIAWLAEDGLEMRKMPSKSKRVSQARLDQAEALLLKHGYVVNKPKF